MATVEMQLSAKPASARLRRFIKKYLVAYLFIAPPVIWTLVFLFVPMVVSLVWSFMEYDGLHPPTFIGLSNYIQLITKDPVFIKALRNTTVFVLLGMSIGPTLGLLTALLLNQKVRFQALFRTAYFLPVMTSMVVVSTIWIMLYNRQGLLNTFLINLGIGRISFLSDPNWALFSLIIAAVWQGFGFETVVFLAALQNIPQEYYEAAVMDGANSVQCFWHITLPYLRPVLLFVYIYGIIGSYQVFDQVFVMTKGGPLYSTTSMVYYLYTKFRDLRLGYSSAIAYILFAILVIFSFVQYRYLSERD